MHGGIAVTVALTGRAEPSLTVRGRRLENWQIAVQRGRYAMPRRGKDRVFMGGVILRSVSKITHLFLCCCVRYGFALCCRILHRRQMVETGNTVSGMRCAGKCHCHPFRPAGFHAFVSYPGASRSHKLPPVRSPETFRGKQSLNTGKTITVRNDKPVTEEINPAAGGLWVSVSDRGDRKIPNGHILQKKP